MQVTMTRLMIALPFLLVAGNNYYARFLKDEMAKRKVGRNCNNRPPL